jgi:hypothetical protein
MAFVTTIVMESRAVPKHSNEANFDTNSTMIDNRCTACNSSNPAHFIGNLTPELKIIKRFHGSRTTSIMTGTIRWQWLDQAGLEHALDIPDSFSYLNENVVCSTRNTGRKCTREQQAAEPGKRPMAAYRYGNISNRVKPNNNVAKLDTVYRPSSHFLFGNDS